MYLFFRRIFPLWFNSKLKKDSGFNQPYFPKIFFGFLQPGDLGHLVCLRGRAHERVAREGKNGKIHHLDFALLSRIEGSFLNLGRLAVF